MHGMLPAMNETLVEFWQRFQPDPSGLQVHPEDREWMKKWWEKPLNAPVYKDWNAYVNSERFGGKDGELHLSLLPIPYLGNLADADIFICLANPGLATGDYYAEGDPSFRQALLDNLHQKSGLEYPLAILNPQFAWTPGFTWWEDRLTPFIDSLRAKGISYHDALKLLSKRMAVLELFPYHSRDTSKLKGVSKPNFLPSVIKMREFFAELTHRPDKLVLVMRRHDHWHHEACAESGERNYIHSAPVRRVTFDPKHAEHKVGVAILKN